MTRQSSVTTARDSAGEYEIEIFDCPTPQRIIVCSHGNGVRRWDGERFFYAVAEHFSDAVVVLVDQNQPYGNGVQLKPLPVLAQRVEAAQALAARKYPKLPVVIMGHSMGCGIVTFMNMAKVSAVIFIAPAAGDAQRNLITRHGADIAHGKTVTTSDGLIKIITADYYNSVKGIVWERRYAAFAQAFQPIYVFAAGDEEIIGPERLEHAQLPFARYEVIAGARHNFAGQPLAELFRRLDTLAELNA